ncbi:MAG: T9SS type A sorting domain-containing protein [Calditrichaeota bacterium]|nr:T9SS type A sorting domain-containing protein [Calditrichota bacterium]
MFIQIHEAWTLRSYIVVVVLLVLSIAGLSQAAHWISLDQAKSEIEPTVQLLEETDTHVLIQWDISGFYVDDLKLNGVDYQRINLSKSEQLQFGNPGEPSFPTLVEIIKFPHNSKGKVGIIDVEWEKVGTFKLPPKQMPTRDDGSSSPPFVFNEDAYNSELATPTEIVSVNSVQGWGGVPVAGVSINPIRFFPSTNTLEIARRMVVRVDFVAGNTDIVQPRVSNPKMQQVHQASILNYRQLDLRPLDADENEPVRLLLVLREEALETSMPLINFYHSTGLRTEVILADEIEDPEVLKNIVREFFIGGLEYVFFIGDGHRFESDVPMFYWDPEDPGEQVNDTDTHSDSWYVCLDEPDEDGFDDHLPDLAIGRLTYEGPDDLAELEIQIAKIMDYMTWNFEQRDNINWLQRSVLVASDDEQDGVPVYLIAKRGVERFDYGLPAPDMIPIYGDDNDVNINTVIDEVNGGGAGFFNYRGHGNETTMYRPLHNRSIDGNIVRQMDNRNMPFILVSSACLNANIATRRADCILEIFQKYNGGSVSAHGSVISTFTDGNSYFDQRIFRAFFDDGVYDLGYAANLAATELVIRYDDNRWPCIGRMNMRAYIWLGNPALEYRFVDPFDLEVDIPGALIVDTEWIEVSVTANDEPVENVRICVKNEDDSIYQVGYSNNDGELIIEFDPRLEGAQLLTWSAYYRDAFLSQGEILVADGFGVIRGQVIDAAEEFVIQDAEVLLSPFNVEVITDVEGNYVINGIPEMGDYTLLVSAEGYNSQIREGIGVVEEEVSVENFEMRFGEVALDSTEFNQLLEADAQFQRDLIFRNVGNDELTWNVYFEMQDIVIPYELIDSREIAEQFGDFRLNGVVFVEDHYYVAGGNNNRDPNYFYKLDRDGILVEMLEQPERSFGVGIQDMAWDGEYLYGSSSNSIFQMTLNGELVREFDGPYNPNTALTVDDSGNLWVGNGRMPLVRIDTDGNILEEIPNEYSVRALAFYPDSEDGYSLQIMERGLGDDPIIHAANPETGDIRFERNIMEAEDDIPAAGLFASRDITNSGWSLVGIINEGASRLLKSWYLDFEIDWIEVDPSEGILGADEEGTTTLALNVDEIAGGTVLETNLILENSGRDPLISILVTVEVESENSVEEKEDFLPEKITVSNAFPNPFNSTTQISVGLETQGKLTVTLHDLSGRRVSTIYSGVQTAGTHDYSISADLMPSGLYLLRINSGTQQFVRKVTLVR